MMLIDISEDLNTVMQERQQTAENTHETGRRLVLTPASQIKPSRVKWLWDGRLALATLALLAGREGQGKSTLAYWKTAQITQGNLPGEFQGTPKSVLVCATEDSWEHTIVPRLIAANADLNKVFRVEIISDTVHHGLSLPRDLHAVKQNALETDAALLLLDPLMSRIDQKLDTHRDSDVRLALEPLVACADQTNMTVLGLIHHNKSQSTDPLQLVMASKAFTAVARSVHTVIPDPDDETGQRRLFGTPKNNLGRTDLPTLGFTIDSYPVPTDEGTAFTSQIVWGADSQVTIGDAMRRSTEPPEQKTATTEAAEWLDDYLTHSGGNASSADIKKAGAAAGHSQDSLKRARIKIGAEIEHAGFPRRTYWLHPAETKAKTQLERQLEQQLEQIPRGESSTTLTTLTKGYNSQSVQLEQSEVDGGPSAPTVAPTGDRSDSPDLGNVLQLFEQCRLCDQPLVWPDAQARGTCTDCHTAKPDDFWETT